MGRHAGVLMALAAATALAGGAGCTVDNPEIPGITGPSELGLSIEVTATPDTLPLDGASQALIRIFARNDRSEPVRNLQIRLQIVTFRGGVITFEDFGQLSARTVTTGTDGRAAATYTVPLGSVNPAGSEDFGTTIEIWATPASTDFSNAIRRKVIIRFVPPGTVIPPAGFSAGFRFTPTSPAEFDNVLFETNCLTDADTNCVRDPNGLVTQYHWDFGDGSTAAGARVSHTYTRAGQYRVALTIADDFGRSTSAERFVVVGAGPRPTAVIVMSPTSPRTNQTVFFDGSRSTPPPGRQIVSYQWDFGDGATASGATTTHVYRAAGTYVARLTVTDDKGAKDTATQSVTVVTSAPTAFFTFSPTAPGVNSPVFFNGSASTATSGRYIVDWNWNFGDGTGASGELVTKTFTRPGTFVVTLIVTDNLGEIGRTSQNVTVGGTGTGPSASFTTSPDSPAPGTSVVFDATASTPSPGATITRYSWNFGDGTAQFETTSAITQHVYAAAGTYTVTLVVHDSLGQTASTSETVTVSTTTPTGPTASFTVSPSDPVVGATVVFDASASTGTIVSYTWNFGDGSALFTTSTPTTTHVYTSPETYVVTLTVRDSSGNTATDTDTFTVGSPGPSADFSVSPSPATVGTMVVVDASPSTPTAGATITSYRWNFGDSTTQETVTTQTHSHVYTTAGVYTITLTIIDSTGATDTSTKTLTIN